MNKLLISLILFSLLISCSTISKLGTKKEHKLNIGLRIATIADTQYTTDKLEDEYLFRTRFADKVSNWAIRTTAQEYLALDNLGYFFNDMQRHQPDVVFYLGDGMNSGCRDEVDDFFNLLGQARTKLDKPIFFLIGNHDYLATGNQIDPDIRLKTCGTNNGIYTKAQLIAKVDEFNTVSYLDFNKQKIFLSFKDNIASFKTKHSWETPLNKACNASNSQDQHKEKAFRCFYSGILEYSKNGVNGQVILTDTSDYRDLEFTPELSLTEFYGTVGGISWKGGGQSDWINKNLGKRNDVRIIASHYKVDQLGYTDFATGRPGDLLLKGKNKNLWLSAHTHIPDPEGGVTDHRYAKNLVNNVKTVHQINVGSTTDFKPHYAIIESSKQGTFKRSYPTAAEYSAMKCEQLVSGIKLSADYLPVLHASRDVKVLLGMTGQYRDRAYQTKNARANLKKFLEGKSAEEQERYARCLLYIGAKEEKTLSSVH